MNLKFAKVSDILFNKKIYTRNKKDPEYKIYFLISGEEIVYIGQTIDIEERLKSHFHGKKEFDSYYSLDCKKEEADLLEYIYINIFKPKYNKDGGKSKKAEENLLRIFSKEIKN